MIRCLLLMLLLLHGACAAAVQQYSFKVLDQKPQTTDTFVQGLEISDGKLYVSSGGYGVSRLERRDFLSGDLEITRRLDRRLFAEGITLFGDRLYQLTWRARQMLIYDRAELNLRERWRIPGEGWGMTNDGEQLIYSDGSHRLYFLSPTEKRITRTIEVTLAGKPVARLNELEWIDGRIWSNVWQTDDILIIDPASGRVEGRVDLSGLLPLPAKTAGAGVLNGIARNPADGGIWVTGKNWPSLYRIELVPVSASPADTSRPESR